MGCRAISAVLKALEQVFDREELFEIFIAFQKVRTPAELRDAPSRRACRRTSGSVPRSVLSACLTTEC
jgi:hypothetical protein